MDAIIRKQLDEISDYLESLSRKGLTGVVVYKPNWVSSTSDGSEGPTAPDVILTNTVNAALVKAMLGSGDGDCDEVS